MNLNEELVERLSRRRSAQLGDLSQPAYAELVLDVRAHPENYLDDPSDQAFSLLVRAIDRVMQSRKEDEFRGDEDFMDERSRRMARLREDCRTALDICPESVDVRLLALIAEDQEPDDQLDGLLHLEYVTQAELGPLAAPASGNAWRDVFLRSRLRILASISRACLDSARYRMASTYAQTLLSLTPEDELGARHTCALALARLEDEEGFEALDARFGRRGDSWTQLSRTILFYKLGRMAAARRSLLGFDRLCEGGAYALLRPIMVDTYLPDRPAAEPYSFDEATLAVHEADPIICDVPDFCTWAEGQGEFATHAQAFAERKGFNW